LVALSGFMRPLPKSKGSAGFFGTESAWIGMLNRSVSDADQAHETDSS
jgi:hypothetical protein